MADALPPTDDAALARQWISALDDAEKDKEREKWLTRCKTVLQVYSEAKDRTSTDKRFALFWANIEVQKPAVLARVPTAVVSRRFRDQDPVGRLASEVLERALNFSMESYDFDAVLKGCRDEFLLLARGVAWVRYVPHLKAQDGEAKSDEITDDAESYEVVDWEEARADYINYKDFFHGPARQWSEVPWVARRAFLTREELKTRFGDEIGAQVPLDYAPEDKSAPSDDDKKAAIYEVWDRTTKTALWISRSWPNQPLDKRPDPLKLKDFFPCPKPALGTTTPDTIVPVPDYVYYQYQLDEIDSLTSRIDTLIDALRVRGFYAASKDADLNTLLTSGNNMLIPVDSWAVLKDAGGIAGLVDWFPIEQVAKVLKECFDARRQLIEDVYQVTGISDIQRGDTDPGETLGAQKLKAGYGSNRAGERKKELARLARDILQIKGEIIASRFDPKTLADMTGVQLLTAQEAAQLQQQAQMYQQVQRMVQQRAQAAQQAGQPAPPAPQIPPPDPAKLQLLGQPTWDDVMAVLRDPALRMFRIDIETDSTIEPNDQEEKQRRIEFIQAIGKYLADSLPVVQAQPLMLPVIAQGLLWLVRGFRVGREMEDIIEQAMEKISAAAANPPPQAQPDPAEQAKAQAAQTAAQAKLMDAQTNAQANQVELAKVQMNHQLGMADVQAENARTAASLHADMQQAVIKSQERRLVHEINDTRPMAAPTR